MSSGAGSNMFASVCAGLASRFGISTGLIRLAFVRFGLFGAGESPGEPPAVGVPEVTVRDSPTCLRLRAGLADGLAPPHPLAAPYGVALRNVRRTASHGPT